MPAPNPRTVTEAAFDAWVSASNISTGLAHPNDRDRLIETVRRLASAGHPVWSGALGERARQHGYSVDHAGEIDQLIGDLNDGKQLRQKDKGPWWNDQFLDNCEKDVVSDG